MRLELAEIREAFAPPAERRLSLNARLTYREATKTPCPTRARTARPTRPNAPAPNAPAPRSAEQVDFPAKTHTRAAGSKSYWGAATPRKTEAWGLFKPVGYFSFFWFGND